LPLSPSPPSSPCRDSCAAFAVPCRAPRALRALRARRGLRGPRARGIRRAARGCGAGGCFCTKLREQRRGEGVRDAQLAGDEADDLGGRHLQRARGLGDSTKRVPAQNSINRHGN
jgi:hypothetical protein